jgi:uncharacterized protein YacL
MEQEQNIQHYYGDTIRWLFMCIGIMMAVSLPFFASLIQIPIGICIIAILTLAVFSGFLNPKQRWVIFAETIIAVLIFLTFEYYAVNAYDTLSSNISLNVYFFWFNQIAAIVSLIAVYLCFKTLRGHMLSQDSK